MTRDDVLKDRVQRMAERRSMRLDRSRRRDPGAADYGRYLLRDSNTRVIVAGATSEGRPMWTLNDVEAYLTGIANRSPSAE
jgi:hypothetical protein